MADREPGRAAADQEAIDADRVQQGHDGGVFDHTKGAPLKVKDLEAQQLGEEQPLFCPLFWHCRPKPILCERASGYTNAATRYFHYARCRALVQVFGASIFVKNMRALCSC